MRSEEEATVGRWTVAKGTCQGWMGAGDGRVGKSLRFMVLISSEHWSLVERVKGAEEDIATDWDHAFAVIVQVFHYHFAKSVYFAA